MLNQQNNQRLDEGLRALDLKGLIEEVIEIDVYRSKMGEDKDVCVLGFVVDDRFPAKDLMEFIEKGYHFVLDADISSGENSKGKYNVFVEISRTPQLAENIKDLEYGIKKLTGVDNFKFKYHKDPGVHDLTEDNVSRFVPNTPNTYIGFLNKVKTEGVKKFFNKTLMDDLTLENDVITFHKPFDNKYKFKKVDEQTISETSISLDERSMSEIFWLTKVLGDYDITKMGDTFAFHNEGETIYLQRIE